MKRRNKNVEKEILIFMALFIIIMLILAVALYDFIPSTITIPETISYASDSTTTSIKQEIAYTNSGDRTADQSASTTEKTDEEIVTALKSYSINASDLTVYGQKNLYNSGNSNPFDYAAEDTTNNATDQANSTAVSIELTAGKYTVGTEIKPGKYNVIAQSGSGNFFVNGSDFVGEMMGVEDDKFYIREYKNLNLQQGDQVEVTSTLKVLLDSGNGTSTGSATNTSTTGTTASGTSTTGTPTSGSTTGTFFERANSK